MSLFLTFMTFLLRKRATVSSVVRVLETTSPRPHLARCPTGYRSGPPYSDAGSAEPASRLSAGSTVRGLPAADFATGPVQRCLPQPAYPAVLHRQLEHVVSVSEWCSTKH